MERISQALQQVVTKKYSEKGKIMELLDCTYKMQVDPNIPQKVRKKVLEDYLLVMLSNSSIWVTTSFYSKNIESILQNVMMSSLHGPEIERLQSMALKISSLKLIANLYAKSPKNVVHSQSSVITEKAFNFLKDNREIAKDATYNGKEMSQFLVKRLKKMRAEIIDGTHEVKESFRICQCEAFNTMMAVISCIQDQEKFYNAFIFREDVGSSELIWERIIDINQEMHFPLETEDVSQRRQKIVAIRKVENSTGDTSDGWNRENLNANHYLRDSSLSQDITTFDFHDSFSSLQSSSQFDDEKEESMNGKHLSQMSQPCYILYFLILK